MSDKDRSKPQSYEVKYPIPDSLHEAISLLDEVERWSELGLSEFIPETARPLWDALNVKISSYLDRVLGKKVSKVNYKKSEKISSAGNPVKSKKKACKK